MKTVLKMFGVVLLAVLCCFVIQGTASCAAIGVRISDLKNTPIPPNPIKVWGKVVSESPVKISDGRSEIEVQGIQAKKNDFLVVTGDWNGAVLITNGQAAIYSSASQIEMIWILAGSFMMGNNGKEPELYFDDDLPQHSVYLSGYWIGKYEVTRGQYRAFINAGGYSNCAYWSTDGWNWKVNKSRTQPAYWNDAQSWVTPPRSFTQTDDYPVIGVTYYEAEAFCNWAGGHLPTEAQWEKAARWNASTSHPNVYPWGDIWDAEKCNNFYDNNPVGGGYMSLQTAPVGSYTSGASPYGCQDMAGNAQEWCKDWYGNSYYSQTPAGGWNDPQGPTASNGRIVRGGHLDCYDIICRCAFRDRLYPTNSRFYVGFRMAR